MSTPYLAKKKVSAIPILSLFFGRVDERPYVGPFDAIVDTGADMTVFPLSLLHQAKARSTGDGQLRTAFGDVHAVTFFLIDVQIENFVLPAVLVAGDKNVQEITLGRNVLNKLAILLDGPQEQTQILKDTEIERLRSRR